MDMRAFIKAMPALRGTLEENVPLAPYTWFRVGGPADLLFRPADEDDLCAFLKVANETDVPVQVIGVGSNLLVRDGGLAGVTIRLGKAFGAVSIDEHAPVVTAGAAALDGMVAEQAARAGIGGLEFMRGIPGTIGGALTMNAGAYGAELKDVLVSATAVDFAGNKISLSPDEMNFEYRRSNPAKPLIFTGAVLAGHADDPAAVRARMGDIMAAREQSQPVRERTGGSTFKNPDLTDSNGRKTWQLIDEAGCRGLRIRNAMVSDQHCNFLINTGEAKAADLEELGESVRERVKETTGVSLQWEIRRVGRFEQDGSVQTGEQGK